MQRLGVIMFLFFRIVTSSTLTLPEGYDPARRPNLGGVADVVNVDVDLLAIRNVEERNSQMTVDVSVQTSWVDARLAELVQRDTHFVKHVPEIWLPNVQIANAADSLPFSAEDGRNYVLQLKKDGSVILRQRVTSTISCQISLAKYPFDRQVCRLQINSYGYSSIHLTLHWHATVSDDVPVYHPEFSFSYVEQTSENIRTATGAEYSNLFLEIAVTRCPLRVIFRALLPSFLLLVFSYYMSFCHCGLLLRSKPVKTTTANGNHHSNHVEEAPVTIIAQPNHVVHESMTSPEPVSAAVFNLLLIALNGMTFLLSMLIAQINFVESPKSSAVSGLDVWLNFVTAVIFVILWHRVQIFFDEYFKSIQSGKYEHPTCYVSRTNNFLKLGIPPVVAVFLVIYFAIYLN